MTNSNSFPSDSASASDSFTADLNHAYYMAWYAEQTSRSTPKPPVVLRSTYSVLSELAEAIPSVESI
jgi:hypothetical protein